MDLNSLFNVKDKIVLITGGSRGIGLMIATGFIANGAKVYISSRSMDTCDKVAKELSDKGPGKAVSIPANLQHLNEVKRLANEIKKREGTASPKDPARVINIGSIAGLAIPFKEGYAYSTSKAALHHLTKVMAGQLSNRQITFNNIAPGPYLSKMSAKTLNDHGEIIRLEVPLGRIGAAEDIAGTAIYLSSKAGAFTNGATITVDGVAKVSMINVTNSPQRGINDAKLTNPLPPTSLLSNFIATCLFIDLKACREIDLYA
ncbi:706_t:CDS:2 [Funneliformis caledonium]|uniref:706_t:CDS:1 n=1 Tax=Funneliformis caledonium TaxID=1117310 RepID=A0A9N9F7T2_9GLOM|nr:706_t:CDS:2 [Funneliformis caledonium]